MSTNSTKTTTKATETTKATTAVTRRRRTPRPILLARDLLQSDRVQAQLKPDRVQEPIEPERVEQRLKPDRVQEKLATLPGWELEMANARILCERKFVYACLAGAYASYAVQAAKELKLSLAVIPNDRSVLLAMSLRPEEPTGLNHLDLALIQALGLGT